FFPQDRHTSFDVRRLKLSGESPFKARNQAVLQICDLGSGPIAGKDDLLMSIEKRIECVKEFFLGPLFTSKKLDVVNQEKVDLAIAFWEFDQITVLDRVNKLVDEQFTGEINHFHFSLLDPDILPDGLHRGGLAKPDTAINEQRVVRACG